MYQVAAQERPKVRPAFIVQKAEGKVKRTLITFDAKNKMQRKEVEEDAGFIVHFPHKKHSIRVRNEAELTRLGFDRSVPLIDENSGEMVGELPSLEDML